MSFPPDLILCSNKIGTMAINPKHLNEFLASFLEKEEINNKRLRCIWLDEKNEDQLLGNTVLLSCIGNTLCKSAWLKRAVLVCWQRSKPRAWILQVQVLGCGILVSLTFDQNMLTSSVNLNVYCLVLIQFQDWLKYCNSCKINM